MYLPYIPNTEGKMTKKLGALIICCAMVACGIACTQRERVYVVGKDGVDAVFWLNGKKSVV
jgi:hypothetical protein